MWGYPRCTMFSHCWGVSRRLITLWCRDWPRASLYSESGPAVHFFLWVTVHTPLIPRRLGSPVQAGNNSLLSHLPWKYEQTFTRGCERDMKQASHIAAAECESVFVSIKLTMWSSARVHAHHVPHAADTYQRATGAHRVLQRHLSPHSQNSATGTSCTTGHRSKHPYTVCSVGQTPHPPPSAEVNRRSQRADQAEVTCAKAKWRKWQKLKPIYPQD